MVASADLFDAVLDELSADPLVARGVMFGHHAGKLGKKVFCWEFHDDLVVKLGRERVAELVAAGAAIPFDPMGGRPMQAWAQIPPGDGDPAAGWLAYAEEAKAFVASEAG